MMIGRRFCEGNQPSLIQKAIEKESKNRRLRGTTYKGFHKILVIFKFRVNIQQIIYVVNTHRKKVQILPINPYRNIKKNPARWRDLY